MHTHTLSFTLSHDAGFEAFTDKSSHGHQHIHTHSLCLSLTHLHNAALQAFTDKSWAQSDGSDILLRKLKENAFFPALQAQMSLSRKLWLETNRFFTTL